MSSDRPAITTNLGFLLLLDGHAVPLAGISPVEIKAGAKHLIPHPDADRLRHRRTLSAIVDRLGFRGDFGTFKNEGWPAFRAFLREHGCTQHARLFPADHGGCYDLFFGPALGPKRRQLADRLFETDIPAPEKVFLGYGVDWEKWDGGSGFEATEQAITTVGGALATAWQRAEELFAHRHDLSGQWGFLDDKLVAGPVQNIVDKTYWMADASKEKQRDNLAQVTKAVLAFRAVFDERPEGWVDVLRVNDRLVVLRAHDGAWDLLWRGYRTEEPPTPACVGGWSNLAIEDLPISLMSKSDLQRRLHFRQEVWEEHEAHAAEQAFYDRGGRPQERRLTSDADVLLAWLREIGRLSAPEQLQWTGEVPPGFRVVEVAGRRLAVSELVDLGTFRQMLVETGYLERRAAESESWERANEGDADDAPVGATWSDAQAFCAWKERQLGVAVRLPGKDELRALRPFYTDRYAEMAGADFLWEDFPPRPIVDQELDGPESHRDLPSAVDWSEPRFLEPGADLPAFPSPNGVSDKSRKRWIEDFPPAASWFKDLPWAEHHGLRFIDAWDAYEWCQEPEQISGRFWEGGIAVTSWGAYKNVKVTFRVVLDLGE